MPLASPFGVPDPHARAAAEELAAQIRRDPTLVRELDQPGGGKMFGVLLVRDPGGGERVLRAFSGMLAGSWIGEGFVGPAFDLHARDAFWIEGEASLGVLADRLAEIDRQRDELDALLAPIVGRHQAALEALAHAHRANKTSRHAARAGADAPTLHALAQASRRDTAARDRLVEEQRAERALLDDRRGALARERERIASQRAERSRELLLQIQDTYQLANARGEYRGLRELFAPVEPPGGAGDCAAPKLFAEAYRRGATPLALAEIWIGAPPPTGGRIDGACYPACRGKCGPILGHMLGGLDVGAAPTFGGDAIDAAEPRTIFEDEWLVVVEKPIGLLSVPGRGDALRDSVLVRLRARYPQASGPLVVHRLDLDTSGLLLAAKDEATYKALQAQFARREIDKRYTAVLDGIVAGDRGTIELALRVDIDDRPRQIYDPVHGKPAITEWRVVDRSGGRTRVALVPRTGRTHQLRVHAAHPLGIGVPIVGDRLYGTAGERLLLHAESLAFEHPRTRARVVFERPAPF